MGFLYIVILMVLIFFLGNYGIHRYYTSQQYKLKISIKNKILADAENIFGELSASSKLSLTDYKILTEIILTEHQIYLLPKIYNFGGKITLNQPVIQLNLNRNDPYKNPYCSRFLEISNILKSGSKLRITAKEKTFLTANYRIILDFRNGKEFDAFISHLKIQG